MKKFFKNLGPVEQAQIVASTAVIVSMATILSAMAATGQSPRLMDFISILTVGLIGFTSVYFSLSYSRQLDEQRRELIAINTLAEAVNRVVELDFVLRTALEKATDLLNIRFGWMYTIEQDTPVLKCKKGTEEEFFALLGPHTDSPMTWLPQLHVQRERTKHAGGMAPDLKNLGIQAWASVPLKAKETISGAMILAAEDHEAFTPKQLELLSSFANQIGVAMHNALLFQKLKASEGRYADLFENTPDIYLNIDRKQIVIQCNALGAAMLGWTRDEIVGRRFDSFFLQDAQQSIRERIASMFDEGTELKNLELRMTRKSGDAFEVSLNSTLVLDAKGTPINARIVARDISEYKKMEAALVHAQKIDSIGALAGGIAHDFNNILSSVLGSASIIRRRSEENSKFSKYVEIIENAARRGSSLTRQLLTFARKTETFIQPMNVNAVVGETLDLFARSIENRIEIKTDFTSAPCEVQGDTGQIQQALLNLFLNAREAMPDGGTLTVRSTMTVADARTASQFTSVKPGPFIRLDISDTGVGMDKSLLSRLFDPFYSTKELAHGLGLSVVYGVVQNHGGFVTVESEPGQGTTFSIYLPKAPPKNEAHTRERRQQLPKGKENILIVDDEVGVSEITRDMLEELGYNVTVVHDGTAGVNTYRARQAAIDLVLVSGSLQSDGEKEARLHFREMNANLPMIILTGYGNAPIEASSVDEHREIVLRKPFQIDDLAMKVRQVLDARIGLS